MVDFDKLNESINAINEVLNDLEIETKAIKKNVDCKKSEAFEIMYNDVLKYIRLIVKASNGRPETFELNVKFDNGYQFGIGKSWYCGHYEYCFKVRTDYCDDWYPIWVGDINKRYTKYVFKSLNRSPKSVQWLVDVVAIEWEEYKIKIENVVATHINNIITERFKKAHKEYECISNEAERLNVEI